MAARFVNITRRPAFTPRKIPGTEFCKRLSRFQGHSAAERIRSIEKFQWPHQESNCDLPSCSIVPQPTTLPIGSVMMRLIWHFVLICANLHVTNTLKGHYCLCIFEVYGHWNEQRQSYWSGDSSVGMMDSDSRQRRYIFIYSTASRQDLVPTQSPIEWVLGALPLGIKRLEREANYSPPSTAEVENGEATTHPQVFMALCLILSTRTLFFTLIYQDICLYCTPGLIFV
jgi:hypothetical protein